MPVDHWQAELRKQFALKQNFKIKNLGNQPVYSDFEVFNPETKKSYKVSIRDNINSYHYCSCPDFRINTLGTCKHIEFVLLKLLKYKKNQKHFSKKQKNDYSSLSILYGHERLIRFKKADTGVQYKNENNFFDSQGYLIPGMISRLDGFIKDASGSDPEFRIYPDVFEFINQHKKNEERNEKIKEIFPDGPDSKIFTDLLSTRLYPYQREGVIGIIRAGRVLLADDMGLGKTIQAIAAVEIFARYFNVHRVLIVCPTSLKYQWKNEIRKFTGRDSGIVEGPIHKRKSLYAQNDFYKIISYGVVRSDIDMIKEWEADLVIVDEAQRIKNWKTQTAKFVKRIHSDYVIVMTGTPLENRIEELHSIVEYIDTYKLGPLFRFLDNHQVLDGNGKLTGYKNLRTINKTLSDILIRRTKKEIISQLPGRVDKNFFVEMTPQQMTDHNSYYDIVTRLVSKWIRFGFLSEEERQNLLTCLNCMRMVSDSTYILNQETNFGTKIDEIKELIKEITENQENKIVIFSQWKRMFELLIRELDKLGMQYVYLSGDIPAHQRKIIIDRFKSDHQLKIFLSTDAGGVGINLQRANMLINIDLPWNPAVLEQRIGRIYRLGQNKHINVFNFISAGSIEHRILHLLDFKRSVFTGVIDEDGKDQVMLEGFLESVKALMNVSLDLPGKDIEKYNVPAEQHDLAVEANAHHLQQSQQDDIPTELKSQDRKEHPVIRKDKAEDKRTGFINIFRMKVKKLFIRFTGIIYHRK